MLEEWRPVNGYEASYEVSNTGHVKSVARKVGGPRGQCRWVLERILRPGVDEHGYRYVNLWKDNCGVTRPVHRLVADVFIPNPTALPCVNHLNTTPGDDRVENLQWCTHQQNMAYSSQFGNARASQNPKRAHKLTADHVEAIRLRREAGFSYVKIGREFGITREMARQICLRRQWA